MFDATSQGVGVVACLQLEVNAMYRFFLSVLILCLLFAGCSSSRRGDTRAVPRPLVAELPVFRPPDREVSSPSDPPTDPTGLLTLEAALALTMQQNPELRAGVWGERASEGNLLQAGLLPNPELEIEAEEFGGTGELEEFEAVEVSFGISQLIELGGKRSRRESVAGLERDVAGWELEMLRLELWRDTATEFVAVLAQQRRLELAQLTLELSREVLENVSERVAAGKVPPLERTRAEVDLATQILSVEQEQSTLNRVRLGLASRWGSNVALFDSLDSRGFDSLDVAVPGLNALAALLPENPELKRWETQIELQRASIDLEEALGVPDLTVGAGLSYFAESDDVGLHAGLSIPLPLFDRNQGAIMAARAELLQAEEQHRASLIRLHRELEDAHLELATRAREVEVLRETLLPAAEKAYQVAQAGYVDGKFAYLEVLDAQRTLFEAQVRAIDAFEGFHSAFVRCEALIGTSLESISEGGQHND